MIVRANIVDQLRVAVAARVAKESPDGVAYECSRCYAILPAPARHYAILTIECLGGADEFAPFKQPVPDPTPRAPIQVYTPAPRPPRQRRPR